MFTVVSDFIKPDRKEHWNPFATKSSSKRQIRNENNTMVVNDTFFESINESSSKIVKDTAMEAAKSCGASSTQAAEMTFSFGDVGGDFNFGGAQTQKTSVDFSCAQSNETVNQATANMVDDIMENIDRSADTDVLAALESNADSSVKAGSISLGSSTENKDKVDTINNLESYTTNHTTLKNIMRNEVVNNFTNKTMDECVAKAINTAKMSVAAGDVAGNVNINVTQDQVADVIASCIQESKTINSAMESFARKVGLTVVEDISTSVGSETEAVATSKTEATGVIGDVGTATSDVIGASGEAVSTAATGIGEGVGSVFGSFMNPYFMGACCCLSVVLGGAAVVLGPQLMGGGGRSNFGQTGGMLNNEGIQIMLAVLFLLLCFVLIKETKKTMKSIKENEAKNTKSVDQSKPKSVLKKEGSPKSNKTVRFELGDCGCK